MNETSGVSAGTAASFSLVKGQVLDFMLGLASAKPAPR